MAYKVHIILFLLPIYSFYFKIYISYYPSIILGGVEGHQVAIQLFLREGYPQILGVLRVGAYLDELYKSFRIHADIILQPQAF